VALLGLHRILIAVVRIISHTSDFLHWSARELCRGVLEGGESESKRERERERDEEGGGKKKEKEVETEQEIERGERESAMTRKRERGRSRDLENTGACYIGLCAREYNIS
jgi:hypothetical protein